MKFLCSRSCFLRLVSCELFVFQLVLRFSFLKFQQSDSCSLFFGVAAAQFPVFKAFPRAIFVL